MKKGIALILLLTLTMGLFGCGDKDQTPSTEGEVPEVTLSDAQKFTVPNPMEYPTYTFDHEPTTDELRQMAIKAMNDMLSIQWCTPKFMTYQKTGAVSGKQFSYVPEIILCGLPYTNGDAAIFNFFEYYDTTTGQLNFPGDGDDFNQVIGNTCTGSIMWGWSTVCDSLTGTFDNYHMTYLNKCYPVGDYVTQVGLDSYQQYGTDLICQDNGKEKILECYALCLPADGLSSSPENHGMMVIEPATVVRKEDGSIDGDASYIIIQDQRAGTGSVFYTKEDEQGNTLNYSGTIGTKYTFNDLYDKWYIPVTTGEFMGTDPYKKAQITYQPNNPNFATPEEMLSGMLTSNYPMCILKLILTDEQGNDTMLSRIYLDKTHVKSGVAREYMLSELRAELDSSNYSQYMEEGKEYTIRLDVTVSTGEIFTATQVAVEG